MLVGVSRLAPCPSTVVAAPWRRCGAGEMGLGLLGHGHHDVLDGVLDDVRGDRRTEEGRSGRAAGTADGVELKLTSAE